MPTTSCTHLAEGFRPLGPPGDNARKALTRADLDTIQIYKRRPWCASSASRPLREEKQTGALHAPCHDPGTAAAALSGRERPERRPTTSTNASAFGAMILVYMNQLPTLTGEMPR